ncbi:2OG-Fe(II) oxygenase [Methylobacillus gramineus]|uniref:2OG-Fe(II) oxygenase n=1 Tax=Methylobacillus gramineus TaxID=755169 RepID=UPI001CFF86D6|nr:2OG-Fe(II) oxygenase [Methylobacillus gramineus]MCB5183676.1 2OG-Fe(II) oxygenase [Methylobacillus gramineus]
MNSTIPLSLKIDQVIEGIANQGYVVIEDFFSLDVIAALRQEARQLHLAGAMQRAATGKENMAKLDAAVRGDLIHWLGNTEPSAVQQDFFTCMEQLREALNRHLYLGLFELENHFAIYPPGAIYRKHLDQFRGNEERQVSCILYLNEDWKAEDGGALRIYLEGTDSPPAIDVMPHSGTLVVFLSAKFWHEVLPARRERISLTGWFRKRSDSLP